MFKWINNNLTHRQVPLSNPNPNPNQPDPLHRRNIDGEILQLEFQCESDASSELLITRLTKLYTLAVGHYQSIDNPRYRIYQRRLESFLKKQNIEEVLNGKSAKLASRRDITERQVLGARIKSRGEVAQILERSERLERINRAKLCSNLSEQEQQLSRRIHKRRAVSTCSSRTKDEEDEEDIRTSPYAILSAREEIEAISMGLKGKKVFI